MTAKKRWLSKIPSEENPDIIWSQPDFNEQVQPSNPNKKLKCDHTINGKGPSWVRVRLLTPPKDCLTDKETEILDHSGELFPSPSVSEESPVLNKLKDNELSPVIQRIRKSPIDNPNTDRDVFKLQKIDWIEPLLHNVDSSPEIFCSTQSSLIIHSMNEVEESPVIISPARSVDGEAEIDIQPVASQHSTEVSEEQPCPSTSSMDLGVALYHQPPPKKKRFKKGGLAHQLQKVLHLQKSSLGIWQHELYLNDNQTDETGVVHFKVRNKFIEYGRTLLECEGSDLGTFLLHIDRSLVSYIDFKIGDSYKMFPPFSNKLVWYKSNGCVCYYNVTRFMSS